MSNSGLNSILHLYKPVIIIIIYYSYAADIANFSLKAQIKFYFKNITDPPEFYIKNID